MLLLRQKRRKYIKIIEYTEGYSADMSIYSEGDLRVFVYTLTIPPIPFGREAISTDSLVATVVHYGFVLPSTRQ